MLCGVASRSQLCSAKLKSSGVESVPQLKSSGVESVPHLNTLSEIWSRMCQANLLVLNVFHLDTYGYVEQGFHAQQYPFVFCARIFSRQSCIHFFELQSYEQTFPVNRRHVSEKNPGPFGSWKVWLICASCCIHARDLRLTSFQYASNDLLAYKSLGSPVTETMEKGAFLIDPGSVINDQKSNSKPNSIQLQEFNSQAAAMIPQRFSYGLLKHAERGTLKNTKKC